MDARVILKDSTARQMSLAHKILLWMQAHPSLLVNTNNNILAEAMSRSEEYALTENTVNSIQQRLVKMINIQMLLRTGTTRRGRLDINYYHKDIPGDVLAGAPEDIRTQVEAMRSQLEDNQFVDNFGSVITETSTREEEPEGEPVEMEAFAKPRGGVVRSSIEPVQPQYEQIQTPIEVSSDGRTISLNITLNINLNNNKGE